MKGRITVPVTIALAGAVVFTPGCARQREAIRNDGPYTAPRPASKPAEEAPPSAQHPFPTSWYVTGPARPWDAIVIHHSACEVGSALRFDRAHRARGWDELGYHFVIGNGSETPDGFVEVGSRWQKQKHGAHCKTPSNHYNEYGIGVCLVGNFEHEDPSANQMASLKKLLAFLIQQYHVPPGNVLGHGQVAGTSTQCPGRYFPLPDVRRWLESPPSP